MAKTKKAKRADRGLLENAGRFARRNRRTLGLASAGAGLAAAALLLGRRYRDQQAGSWDDADSVGTASAI